jgi:hypothetical protein
MGIRICPFFWSLRTTNLLRQFGIRREADKTGLNEVVRRGELAIILIGDRRAVVRQQPIEGAGKRWQSRSHGKRNDNRSQNVMRSPSTRQPEIMQSNKYRRGRGRESHAKSHCF